MKTFNVYFNHNDGTRTKWTIGKTPKGYFIKEQDGYRREREGNWNAFCEFVHLLAENHGATVFLS